MPTKVEAERKVKYVKDAFLFSLGAYALATREPIASELMNKKVRISDNNQDIFVLSEGEMPPKSTISFEVKFRGALNNHNAETFVRQTFLYMIQETFEVIKRYAELGGKSEIFKSAEWYPFARHLRNAIGHGGRWKIDPGVKDLPTTFRNKTITLDMNGAEIGDFVSWLHGQQLCAAMEIWLGEN
ncbi:hypothetical protein [Rheinheimera aquimaris]|jgi:hypothetical protein|uniref:hypothetical protein n=1 Tax=Rheinheimera aquimaris TaxID=412437 RepID=UPI0010651EFC|nr:hypothetical protein [Rheinheimera aquimaris]|tara:strand:- start:1310 stop:1864 length:555 start_codon:yes stop_codon:yes gene_type:complete